MCKTWSLTVNEEYILRILEKRNKQKVTKGYYWKVHNEEFHNLNVSPNNFNNEIKDRWKIPTKFL